MSITDPAGLEALASAIGSFQGEYDHLLDAE
jgi:hypothetical protein